MTSGDKVYSFKSDTPSRWVERYPMDGALAGPGPATSLFYP